MLKIIAYENSMVISETEILNRGVVVGQISGDLCEYEVIHTDAADNRCKVKFDSLPFMVRHKQSDGFDQLISDVFGGITLRRAAKEHEEKPAGTGDMIDKNRF